MLIYLFFDCRKGIKLYSEFYSSDVIIASPVGLVTVRPLNRNSYNEYFYYFVLVGQLSANFFDVVFLFQISFQELS